MGEVTRVDHPVHHKKENRLEGYNKTPTNNKSIPLETMLPSYERDNKADWLSKNAELTNYNNGLWSLEGNNAYDNPDASFEASEKRNGASKSSDEISLPVSNHRKCRSRGERFYFTEESRKGWRKIIVRGLILIIVAVAITLCTFAAVKYSMSRDEFLCDSANKCVNDTLKCDGIEDCPDDQDEFEFERTACKSGGRFFCDDGLCIPWAVKCDGEHDCKEGEDERNCTCFSEEFQCNDGKCLKSSSRCDGHQDCHNAEDEMGCVNVDEQHIVSTYEPNSGTWGLLCANDWNLDDGQYLCQELGFGHALHVGRVHVSFDGPWMALKRKNFTEASLWTERVSLVEICTSGLAATVECQTFHCGEFESPSSSKQWPFIGYISRLHSNRECLSEIVTPVWLITSVECLLSISKEPLNGSDWYVRTVTERDIEVDAAQNHEVLRIVTHPHSSKFRSLTVRDYDVALVRLKRALVFENGKIEAICLPYEAVYPGISCFPDVIRTEKRTASLPVLTIMSRRNCNRLGHFNNTINHRMLCAQSSEGYPICDNDEGLPLVCVAGINSWFLAGMLTFCDVYSKHPAVFSNLLSMRKYLDQVIGQKQYEIPYDNSIYTIISPATY